MDNRNESDTFITTLQIQNTTTFLENTTSSDENLDLRVPAALTSSLMFICVITAWVLNIMVLRAMGRVPENRLKVRYLLRNAIVGDMMLALSLGIRVIFELLSDSEDNNGLAKLCANLVYDFYGYWATFYQIFSSMAVGIDRFVSILKPLYYHTMKYTLLAKTVVVGAVFSLSVGLSLPVIVLKFEPGVPFIEVCYKADDNSLWYAYEVLPAIVIVSVISTLVLYCVIFIMIICHRRKSRNTLGERSESQNSTKREISLAMTFFFIHITYVLMYLPGALFHSILSSSLEYQPYLHYYLAELTIVIYLGNAIVDPLIYIFRIRSIRDEFVTLCCLKRTKALRTKPKVTDASRESKSIPITSTLTSLSIVDQK